jgi:outer membrane autotransporter protein
MGRVNIDFYGGGGVDRFDSRRIVRLGDFGRSSAAEWTGYHAAASLRASTDLNPEGRFFVRPALSVDYLTLEEEGYTETGGGTGVDLQVEDRSSDIFASTASLAVGGTFNKNGRVWWSPRLRAGYRVEHSGDPGLTSARFVGGQDFFELTAGELPDSGGVFGFTFAAGSRYSSFALDYDADLRDGFTRHVARVAFRFLF